MANKRVLGRLLRLRELEEELSRAALELAVAERHRVEAQQEDAQASLLRGRKSFAASVLDGGRAERAGAVIEMERARMAQLRIAPRLQAAEAGEDRRRGEFLNRRTGRQQVEKLLENHRRQAELEDRRRAQQMLDDWYGRKKTPAPTK